MNIKNIALIAALALSPVALLAQTPTPGQNDQKSTSARATSSSASAMVCGAAS